MKLLHFFGTVWGWLTIALVAALWAFAILTARENERTDFNLRVWQGVDRSHTPTR
ncbi:hypothetical protein [Aquidulcibacter paucihalophilus]|uniref:hypothetical protein n=1 Tax=Aquidulcibacter paucihalophilus TaxID=1978549 RepID=UPI0012FF5B33|nr:hypothetical protein [Aquidulcibacter paucihalophilus]